MRERGLQLKYYGVCPACCRARGDPEKCKEATDQANSPRFKKCEDVFFDHTGHQISPEDARQFCNDDCASFLSQVQQAVMAECNISVIKTVSFILV